MDTPSSEQTQKPPLNNNRKPHQTQSKSQMKKTTMFIILTAIATISFVPISLAYYEVFSRSIAEQAYVDIVDSLRVKDIGESRKGSPIEKQVRKKAVNHGKKGALICLLGFVLPLYGMTIVTIGIVIKPKSILKKTNLRIVFIFITLFGFFGTAYLIYTKDYYSSNSFENILLGSAVWAITTVFFLFIQFIVWLIRICEIKVKYIETTEQQKQVKNPLKLTIYQFITNKLFIFIIIILWILILYASHQFLNR